MKNNKHTFWDWMIIVVVIGLLAWSVLGCTNPKTFAVTHDGIAFGGPDAPIQTSWISWHDHFHTQDSTLFIRPTVQAMDVPVTINHIQPQCSHSVINILFVNPPKYECFLCGEDVTPKPKPACDHFYVSQYVHTDWSIERDQYRLFICIYCNEINVCL